MRRQPPGRTVTVSTAGEPFRAFVPAPLPPKPALEWSPALRRRFDGRETVANLYDTDFVACTKQQTDALREGRLDSIDRDNLTELESMGKQQVAELLAVLLARTPKPS